MFSTAAAAPTGSPAIVLTARSGGPSPSSASSRPALRPSPFLSAVGKGSGALALAALVSLAGGRPASAAFLSSPAPNSQQRSCSMATTATASASGPDSDNPGPGLELAEFGAGCFWGVELAFQRVPGVLKTEVGYTQGSLDNPTYEQVCSGRSGHVEAVRVVYDPKEVSYDTLLDVLWARHDPTTLNRQGGDVGTQYRSGIYYFSPEQEKVARASLERRQAEIGRKIVTEILPAKKWYRAEEYHQQYLAKGGRFGLRQSTAKGCNDPIRCYG